MREVFKNMTTVNPGERALTSAISQEVIKAFHSGCQTVTIRRELERYIVDKEIAANTSTLHQLLLQNFLQDSPGHWDHYRGRYVPNYGYG